jgi:hypothetical protein
MTETTTAVTTPPPVGIDVQDAAWIRVPTTLTPSELATHLNDIEVLLRLNPYYYFKTLKSAAHDRWHAEYENQSNKQQVATDIEIKRLGENGISLNYANGLRKRTVFTVEPFEQGSHLVVTDDYSGSSEMERQQREAEIDKSLNAWGESLRVYFLRLQRYSRIPGWRWYIRRLWIPMKPSARRIVWLLAIISLVEFAFFCFVLLIWVIEQYSK